MDEPLVGHLAASAYTDEHVYQQECEWVYQAHWAFVAFAGVSRLIDYVLRG